MSPCPCGTTAGTGGPPLDLDACCGPLVDGARDVGTCEELMRSRYTAFALGRPEHLARSWHPRTRPDAIDTGGVHWEGLRVLDVVDGGPPDDTGVVEFEARYRGPGGSGVLHERSRFARRAGRWVYVDGEVDGD